MSSYGACAQLQRFRTTTTEGGACGSVNLAAIVTSSFSARPNDSSTDPSVVS